MKHLPFSTNAVALLTAAVIAISLTMAPAAQAQNTRVFELRTYYAHEGKLDDLMARFRNHTTKLFEKHGMTNIGYWVPREQPNTLTYVLAYPSREAATKSWDAFRKDPDWIAARTASLLWPRQDTAAPHAASR